jgi:hypothetical protein
MHGRAGHPSAIDEFDERRPDVLELCVTGICGRWTESFQFKIVVIIFLS